MFDTLQTFIAPRLRSFLKLLSIGHFHKKRIVFFSYFGAQYSCNPKYISEYMQERHPDFEIIWAFKSPQNFSYLHDKGIKTVKYLHPYFLHVCLTSKFIVTNSEIPAWFPIMKRQVYINTCWRCLSERNPRKTDPRGNCTRSTLYICIKFKRIYRINDPSKFSS